MLPSPCQGIHNRGGSLYREHGVSFAEAATVLEDDFALTRDDPQLGAARAQKRVDFEDLP